MSHGCPLRSVLISSTVVRTAHKKCRTDVITPAGNGIASTQPSSTLSCCTLLLSRLSSLPLSFFLIAGRLHRWDICTSPYAPASPREIPHLDRPDGTHGDKQIPPNSTSFLPLHPHHWAQFQACSEQTFSPFLEKVVLPVPLHPSPSSFSPSLIPVLVP